MEAKKMRRMAILIGIFSMMMSSSVAFADWEPTAAQQAEMQRQQAAAQRAYEASASTYDEVANTAASYQETAQDVYDTSLATLAGGATGTGAGAAVGATYGAWQAYSDD